MTSNPVFYHVAELAQRLGGPITVYDLEATTFRGRPNFGITEVACFVVLPKGDGLAFQSLINPERPIDPYVSTLTGITDNDVRSAELWNKRYAQLFAKMAKEQWVCGFNNSTFDNYAVIDMGKRYGIPIEKFEKTFDVLRLHAAMSNAGKQKGNLQEVAARYGVTPRGHLHRAQADVMLTLELLHAIIGVYGLDAVCNYILPKPEGAVDKLTAKAIAKYVKSKANVTIDEVANAFAKDARTASFEIGKAIDERLLNPDVFAHQEAQAWLDEALMEVELELLNQGKLKPLYDELVAKNPNEGILDYVQLRIALLRAGLTWSSLKPQS